MESFCYFGYLPYSRQNSFKSRRTRAHACWTVLEWSLKNAREISMTLKQVLRREGCLSVGSIKLELNALAMMEMTST